MSATLQGNFVLLQADDLRLLVPGEDVGAAEHLGEVQRARLQPRDPYALDGAVALSGQLRPLAHLPADRFVLTRFACGAAFVWNRVQVLLAVDLPRHPLPPALSAPGVPVDAFAEVEGRLVLCTDAARLLAFVKELLP